MSGRHRKPDAETEQPQPTRQPQPAERQPAERPQPAPQRSPVAPPLVVPRRSRAAERARRRAAARRRVLFGLGAVVVVAGVVLVGLWLTGGPPGTDEPRSPAAAGKQFTLLVQVVGEDGVADASALLGVTPRQHSGAAVLVPSGLLVDLAGSGTVPYGETTTSEDAAAGGAALTDLLGVRVDETWVLSRQGLATMVDSVGGVTAAVDVDVTETDGEGNTVVVVRAGNQRLDGRTAAAYATFLADGEPEQARLARFDDVLSGIVEGLTAQAATVTATVRTLGTEARSTGEPETIAERLVQLHAAAARGGLVSDVLPVTEIDSGGTVPTYGIAAGQAAAMMRARFPGALLATPDGDVLRVLVENGLGTPGLVEAAREKLVAAGLRFVNGGNAAEFTNEPSSVIIPDGTEESLRRGQRVAEALGLPESAIATSDRGQTVADVIVILGSDFAP